MTKAKPKPIGRPKSGREKLVTVLNLKGSSEFHQWLAGFHAQTHIPRATLVRLGLKLLAERQGYSPPPEM